MDAQSAVYMAVAEYLHQQGLSVYVRQGYDAAPMRFKTPVTVPLVSNPHAAMSGAWMDNLQTFIFGKHITTIVPSKAHQTVDVSARLLAKNGSFTLTIRNQALLVIPDMPLDRQVREYPQDWIIVDLKRYLAGQGGIAYLKENASLTLGEEQHILHSLSLPKRLLKEPLRLENKKGVLQILRGNSTVKVTVQALLNDDAILQFRNQRSDALRQCCTIYGGVIASLSPSVANDVISRVNKTMAREVYRPANKWGEVGAILDLPDNLTPIIVGDLHGQVDNLLKILTHPECLKGMEANKSCLILLGVT